MNWPLKVGWAGSVLGMESRKIWVRRARFIRITERSSVYLEHVREKVVREELERQTGTLNLGTPVKGFGLYPGALKSLKI